MNQWELDKQEEQKRGGRETLAARGSIQELDSWREPMGQAVENSSMNNSVEDKKTYNTKPVKKKKKKKKKAVDDSGGANPDQRPSNKDRPNKGLVNDLAKQMADLQKENQKLAK